MRLVWIHPCRMLKRVLKKNLQGEGRVNSPKSASTPFSGIHLSVLGPSQGQLSPSAGCEELRRRSGPCGRRRVVSRRSSDPRWRSFGRGPTMSGTTPRRNRQAKRCGFLFLPLKHFLGNMGYVSVKGLTSPGLGVLRGQFPPLSRGKNTRAGFLVDGFFVFPFCVPFFFLGVPEGERCLFFRGKGWCCWICSSFSLMFFFFGGGTHENDFCCLGFPLKRQKRAPSTNDLVFGGAGFGSYKIAFPGHLEGYPLIFC